MRPNLEVILTIPLVCFACGAAGPACAHAQESSRAQMDLIRPKLSSATICEDPNVNAQVRDALRLVCLQRGSDEALASAQNLIVFGFLGGFAKDGDRNHPEVWFGAYLREHYGSASEILVISNHRRRRAMNDIVRILDTDHDGFLTAAEKRRANIILYGHSWGASEAAAFARDLNRIGIPVLLTVQIDIVAKPGQKPILIPPNVEAAINFFQSEGFLHGRSEVVAEDAARTEIIANLRMTYDGRHVDCRNYPWFARTFNKPHHEIENDARVWNEIALIIDSRLSSLRRPMGQTAMR